MASGVMAAHPVPAMSSVPYLLRVLLSRPALWACVILGMAVACLVPLLPGQSWLIQAMLGWNSGAGLFLVLVVWQFFGPSHASPRVLAMLQQAGRRLALVLAVAAALLCLGAVVAALATARELPSPQHRWLMALAALTFATSWAFTQAMFARHYAQTYFYVQVQGLPEVFQFSDQRRANPRGFLRLAIGLGSLGQSDGVILIGAEMRGVATVQRVLAVLFNLTLLVLVVNLGSILF